MMKTVLSGETYGKLRLALLVMVLAVTLCSTAQPAVLYESATLGATGVTGPYATVSYDQWFCVRVQITQPVLVTRIGGHFVAAIPGSAAPARTFFGAVVHLTGQTDFPDTNPTVIVDIDQVKRIVWDGPDILARIDMVAPNTSADIRADLPGGGILLQPGYYALIFGSPASSSRVGMVSNGSDIGTVSGFDWIAWSEIDPGSPFPDDWYPDPRNVGPGLTGGTRFVVEGTIACDPATYVPVPTTCGVGVCASTGQTSCVNNIVVDSCTPGTPTGADNTCNGLDENCNGTADENYVPTSTSCGAGACARTGQNICVSGQLQNTCTPGTPTGTDNTCNGIDENCNGTADENYVPTSTSCGVGACASTGQNICVSGQLQNTCTPGIAGTESFTEGNTCSDTLDNDCDGLVDLGDPGCIDNPQIAIAPASNDFGIINVGSMSVIQAFTVANVGGVDLVVSSIDIVSGDTADFNVVPDSCPTLSPVITGGSGCTVTVALTPSAAAARSALLRITSNASNGQTLDIPLAGEGTNLPVFEDAPESHWAENYINSIFYNGVTTGCDPAGTLYCPANYVTRQAMAAFIIRAIEGEPPLDYCGTGSPFIDVPTTHQFCRYIKRLSERSITTGCNEAGTLYCPANTVTRQAMAAFIVRALYGESFPYAANPYFADVFSGSQFFKYVQRMKDDGITTGCNAPANTLYCPGSVVNRAQMAAFMSRAFLGMP